MLIDGSKFYDDPVQSLRLQAPPRTEVDRTRVEELVESLQKAVSASSAERSAVQALGILAELGASGVIPRLDAATGAHIAELTCGLLEPLRRGCAGAVADDDLRSGLTAGAEIAGTFGREWEELLATVGADLMLDRIGNVLVLANAISNVLLRRASVERGEPHRRKQTNFARHLH